MAFPDVPSMSGLAVAAHGYVYAIGNEDEKETSWIRAWDLDGVPQWSRAIDPAVLGMRGDNAYLVDVDAVEDDVVIAARQWIGAPWFGMLARLDAETGGTKWASAVNDAALDALPLPNPKMPAYDVRLRAVAVTPSGRVFAHGSGLTGPGHMYWAMEYDPRDGSHFNPVRIGEAGPIGPGTSHFLAHDTTGFTFREFDIYHSVGSRVGFNGLRHTPPFGRVSRLAQHIDGRIALQRASCTGKYIDTVCEYFVEVRDAKLRLIAGGEDASPEIRGGVAFTSDGGLVVVGRGEDIARLSPDLDLLSVDPMLDLFLTGFAVLPDNDLILSGFLGGTDPVLRRYASCDL